jgi:hypothetical protein
VRWQKSDVESEFAISAVSIFYDVRVCCCEKHIFLSLLRGIESKKGRRFEFALTFTRIVAFSPTLVPLIQLDVAAPVAESTGDLRVRLHDQHMAVKNAKFAAHGT